MENLLQKCPKIYFVLDIYSDLNGSKFLSLKF